MLCNGLWWPESALAKGREAVVDFPDQNLLAVSAGFGNNGAARRMDQARREMWKPLPS